MSDCAWKDTSKRIGEAQTLFGARTFTDTASGGI